MNVEQTLTEELETVARSFDVPLPPAAATLVQEARHTRSRTRFRVAATTLVAAAAVIAAIVLGTQLDDPKASPGPAPQPTELPTALPTGAPPAISFVRGDKLYVNGRVQPGSWYGVLNRGATSVAYLGEPATLTQTIVLFHDGSEVVRVPGVSVQGPVLSPTGSRAAWVERDGSSWYLVVFDLEAGHEQGRMAVDAKIMGHVGEESEAWESLSSVDDTGDAVWGGVLEQHSWTPGTVPTETAPDSNPGAATAGFPSDVAGLVVLSPDGAWGAWTEDHTGEQQQGGSEIPDQYTVEVWAQKPGRPDSRIELKLPRNTFATEVAWETTATFLVTVADDPTGVAWHYLRCSVVDRHCEHAPTPGDH